MIREPPLEATILYLRQVEFGVPQILRGLDVAPDVLVVDDVKDLLQAAVRVGLRIPQPFGRVPEVDLLLTVGAAATGPTRAKMLESVRWRGGDKVFCITLPQCGGKGSGIRIRA